MVLASLPMAVLLLQAPGDGWALDQQTRHVRRLYWDLFQTTEVCFASSPTVRMENRHG